MGTAFKAAGRDEQRRSIGWGRSNGKGRVQHGGGADEITAARTQMLEMATNGNVVCVPAHLNATRMRLEFLSEEATFTAVSLV